MSIKSVLTIFLVLGFCSFITGCTLFSKIVSFDVDSNRVPAQSHNKPFSFVVIEPRPDFTTMVPLVYSVWEEKIPLETHITIGGDFAEVNKVTSEIYINANFVENVSYDHFEKKGKFIVTNNISLELDDYELKDIENITVRTTYEGMREGSKVKVSDEEVLTFKPEIEYGNILLKNYWHY
ncbi:hypothetical protein QTG56_25400 (plasmid) [Rossellomorea sp. AcN35-11]|nr:hypothetical protein [Rossellomorea aquimaris]WJV31953.1 hypothetical protein QTG56_25400 [Rossellomorea sp. AcN35-11]